MHEVSLVRSLLRQVDELRRDHDAASVSDVRIAVGPLSGVEPVLVEEAFDQLKIGTELAATSLTIDLTDLTAECRQCESDFEVQNYRFACPNCGSTSVRVTGGDQFRLVNVTIECDPSTTPKENASLP